VATSSSSPSNPTSGAITPQINNHPHPRDNDDDDGDDDDDGNAGSPADLGGSGSSSSMSASMFASTYPFAEQEAADRLAATAASALATPRDDNGPAAARDVQVGGPEPALHAADGQAASPSAMSFVAARSIIDGAERPKAADFEVRRVLRLGAQAEVEGDHLAAAAPAIHAAGECLSLRYTARIEEPTASFVARLVPLKIDLDMGLLVRLAPFAALHVDADGGDGKPGSTASPAGPSSSAAASAPASSGQAIDFDVAIAGIQVTVRFPPRPTSPAGSADPATGAATGHPQQAQQQQAQQQQNQHCHEESGAQRRGPPRCCPRWPIRDECLRLDIDDAVIVSRCTPGSVQLWDVAFETLELSMPHIAAQMQQLQQPTTARGAFFRAFGADDGETQPRMEVAIRPEGYIEQAGRDPLGILEPHAAKRRRPRPGEGYARLIFFLKKNS
jgi:hypothetical protein